MPLNRPALTLGPGPRGVQAARRWVVGAYRDMGRHDLVECAELGVSELVTNALLHATAPLSVRVRGTREHPRVEVRDGSVEPPVLPPPDPHADKDQLLTFGRGLSIVARCSSAWGAQIEDDGKVVWFVPGSRAGDDIVEGVVTDLRSPAPVVRPSPDEVGVELRGVPLRSFVEFEHHYRELRREVRLLALAHEDEYPLARNLSDLFSAVERNLHDRIGADQIDVAMRSGAETTDLQVAIPPDSAATLGRFIELLDLADEFCREERLLSLARTPEQRTFQRWFFGEFVRQEKGEAPLAWQDAPASRRHSRHSSVS